MNQSQSESTAQTLQKLQNDVDHWQTKYNRARDMWEETPTFANTNLMNCYSQRLTAAIIAEEEFRTGTTIKAGKGISK